MNPAVAGEDGHGGKLHRLRERFDAPVELVITDDPGVVLQRIEEANHERTLSREARLGALVNVADIDERPVRVFLLPAADLGGTTGQAAEIGAAAVIGSGQDVAVQIGGVKDGDRDRRAGIGKKSARQTGQQCALAESVQEMATRKTRRGDRHEAG